MPVQGTAKTIVPRRWRWLGNCCLRPNHGYKWLLRV